MRWEIFLDGALLLLLARNPHLIFESAYRFIGGLNIQGDKSKGALLALFQNLDMWSFPTRPKSASVWPTSQIRLPSSNSIFSYGFLL